MSRVSFTQSTIFIDPKTGQLTRDGFDLVQFFVQSVNGAGAVMTIDGAQTVTNKTIDGDLNTLRDIATGSLKTRTGLDLAVATGTAGATNSLAMWNVDGDLIDASLQVSAVVTATGAQALTNKTFQDSTSAFVDEADATKKLAFQTSGIATATTRTVTAQDKSGTMGLLEGTVTNDDAAAGQIGEVISSSIASGAAVALTTNVSANVTSISLTAGDWDVRASALFLAAATTSITALTGSISQTSATLGAALVSHRAAAFVPGAVSAGYPVGTTRISLAATTTIYLVAQATFTVSTLGAYGSITARRAR